jgi:hypothetical protein
MSVLGCVRAVAVLTAVVPFLAGCIASIGQPERLYPVPDVMIGIRSTQKDLADQYYGALTAKSLDHARALRNELIAQWMYAIDVQYSQYEAALTRERQEVGFATLTTAEGLSTAATLVASAQTKTILSGLTTAVIATKGHYESEVLLAQTMRTIQKQMRASRNKIAEYISAQMGHNVIDYPLAAALSDLEDYYRAGTLTSGVIDASTTVGIEERQSAEQKQSIALLPAQARRAAILRDTTMPIPAPAVLPVLNPTGLGFFERRLVRLRIRELQRWACVEESGKFSASLRTVVVSLLKKSDKKDDSFDDRITDSDMIFITRELRNKRRAC